MQHPPRRRMMGRRLLAPLSTLICLLSLLLTLEHARSRFGLTAEAATNFSVTNTGDSGPGSLRQAITDANASLGTDTIIFNIPGSGVQTIALLSDLPIISDPLVIDGATQPGYVGTPLIELNGNRANRSNTSRAGLFITAGSSTVRALVINRFSNAAVVLAEKGDNTIQSSYIGTDAMGNVRSPNSVGIIVNTPRNMIGGVTPEARNVISGNDGNGIEANVLGATQNIIQGNFIGVNAAGSKALGNSGSGISGAFFNTIIGGTMPGAGNVVSANGRDGLNIKSDNVVQGNFIGTNASGQHPLGNSERGIRLSFASNNLIGGASTEARNVIAGNFGAGISLEDGARENHIQGNYIGVDAAGTKPLPNSPSGFGVFNSAGGIMIRRAANNVIGGSESGAGNVIAFNGTSGVRILESSSTGNTVSHNSIFGNNGLGIDIEAIGVNPNDPADGDAGANNQQNFPVVTSVESGSGATTVRGTLNSTPNTTFTVELFANSGCDPSGNGEGASFIGSTAAATDANGNAEFGVTIQTVITSPAITATATDSAGNTSEFSPCDSSRATGIVGFGTGLSVREDIGSVSIEVLRTGGSAGQITVDYATKDVTAVAEQDYTSATGTLTFAPGEVSKIITIPILNDSVLEESETFTVTLHDPLRPETVGSLAMTVVRVFDRSSTTVLSAGGARVMEGDSGRTEVEVTIESTVAIGQTVTVNYATVAMTAQSGTDFQAVSGTLTFAPGVTTQKVRVPIIGDTLDEFDETFRIALSNAVNAATFVSSNPSTILIVDDDLPPTVSISDLRFLEGSSSTNNTGNTFANFIVSLSAPSGKSIYFQYSTAHGTANSSDYGTPTPPNFNSFPLGDTTATITIQVYPDNLIEPDETFFVNIRVDPLSNVTLGDSQAIGTIVNDDVTSPPPTPTPSPTPAPTPTPTPTPTPAPSDVQAEVRAWTIDGTTQAFVKVVFPDDSYAVADWGQVAASGTDFTADARLTRGAVRVPVALATANIYNLGALAPGSYTFTFKVGGVALQTEPFTVSGTPAAGNPVDDASRFVQEQYRDFLSREPDAPGLNFWTREITVCGTDAGCIDRKRVNTSGAFFLSSEFQGTGYYLYRIYKGALNRRPRFVEFRDEVRTVAQNIVVGNALSPENIDANKRSFALSFVQRAEFLAIYDALPAAGFVDRLFQHTGAARTEAERQALVLELESGAGTQAERRARVLYRMVDGTRTERSQTNPVDVISVYETSYGRAFYNQEYNPAFVLMEYFGYLRRDPDEEGYGFWLAKLNRFGNFTDAEMVKAFILSAEYRSRFGQP